MAFNSNFSKLAHSANDVLSMVPRAQATCGQVLPYDLRAGVLLQTLGSRSLQLLRSVPRPHHSSEAVPLHHSAAR